MVTLVPPDPYGEYRRMGRFGGWQAKWLAPVIMMTTQGRDIQHGVRYEKEVEFSVTKAGSVGTWAHAVIYGVGLVEIDEFWLNVLIPDEAKRAAFMRGDEHEFYAES